MSDKSENWTVYLIVGGVAILLTVGKLVQKHQVDAWSAEYVEKELTLRTSGFPLTNLLLYSSTRGTNPVPLSAVRPGDIVRIVGYVILTNEPGLYEYPFWITISVPSEPP